jgi:hypothetical protein
VKHCFNPIHFSSAIHSVSSETKNPLTTQPFGL